MEKYSLIKDIPYYPEYIFQKLKSEIKRLYSTPLEWLTQLKITYHCNQWQCVVCRRLFKHSDSLNCSWSIHQKRIDCLITSIYRPWYLWIDMFFSLRYCLFTITSIGLLTHHLLFDLPTRINVLFQSLSVCLLN